MNKNVNYYQFIMALLGLWLLLIPAAQAATQGEQAIPRSVKIGLMINDISTINEVNETISFEGTLTLKWLDPSLKNSNSKKKFYVGSAADNFINTIWFPYFVFAHGRGLREDVIKYIEVMPNGFVSYHARFFKTVETKIDMRQFPFDKQTLVISMKPFVHNFAKMDLTIDKVNQGVGGRSELEEWYIKNISSEISNNASKMPVYTIKVEYQRKSAFYISRVVVPLLLVVVLSWSVFWLERQPTINCIAILLTALLTIVAFQWVVISTTPKVSYHTFFQSLLLFSYIMVASAIVASTIAGNLSNKRKHYFAVICRFIFPITYFLGILALVFIYF